MLHNTVEKNRHTATTTTKKKVVRFKCKWRLDFYIIIFNKTHLSKERIIICSRTRRSKCFRSLHPCFWLVAPLLFTQLNPLSSPVLLQAFKIIQEFLPIICLLANISDVASTWELMRASSIRRKVWSPLAPIHVALRPYLEPMFGIGAGFAFQ